MAAYDAVAQSSQTAKDSAAAFGHGVATSSRGGLWALPQVCVCMNRRAAEGADGRGSPAAQFSGTVPSQSFLAAQFWVPSFGGLLALSPASWTRLA